MKKDSVIEKLHKVQEQEKSKTYLEQEKLKEVANECGVTPAQVYGVATFYTMFSTQPRGRHIIRICRNLACHLAEAEAVVKAIKATLGVDVGGTSKDGEFTLEESSCLGMCAVAPAMMIDDVPYANLTPDSVKQILATVRAGGKK